MVTILVDASEKHLGRMANDFGHLAFDDIPASRFKQHRDKRFLGKKAKQISRQLSKVREMMVQLDKMSKEGTIK